MSSKRVTRSSSLSQDFQGLLQNLHGGPQQNSNAAFEHTTLVEASKKDVDKLLGRAGARGAAARAKGSAELNTSRGRKKHSFPEGEENLFYQRNVEVDVGSSGDISVCGASASTLVDVKYGSSSGHKVPSESNCEARENTLPGIVGGKEVDNSSCKSDAHDELFSMDDGCEWELGSNAFAGSDWEKDKPWDGEIKIEMDVDTPSTSEKKSGKQIVRRANAKDKEFAELVHKTHLLCMIARGRLLDMACDDPILQASLFSIVPDHVRFHNLQQISILELEAFVKWFQSTFQINTDKSVTSPFGGVSGRVDLVSRLLEVLHNQAGSSEEVAALSVSVLRALGVSARYATVLDVIALKPDSSSLEASADWDASNGNEGFLSQRLLSAKLASSLGQVFSQFAPQTLTTAVNNAFSSPTIASHSPPTCKQNLEETPHKQESASTTSRKGKQKVDSSTGSKSQSKRRKKIEFESSTAVQFRNEEDVGDNKIRNAVNGCVVSEFESKRKGDLEFELQLAMAMAATAATSCQSQEKASQKLETKQDVSHLKERDSINIKTRKRLNNAARPVASGSAVWSRKIGPLLHWAEVFCAEKGSGRWVHVDAGRGLLDSAELVEEAARSCKVPLRYVLAFAGSGAKDVTRRYVTLWSSVAPLRVSNDWWNITLAPLKELEAAGASIVSKQEEETRLQGTKVGAGSTASFSRQPDANTRSSLEDMELDRRACTEPLPKNQQAYKTHHLYALEKWLTKYQGLQPRGPILGYCGGHPVFPRACVQDLHTPDRWLREGLKVKPNELPAKIVKNARLVSGKSTDGSFMGDGENMNEAPTTALFGKWQTEPWHPPPAVDGIVPKNERGNVELWSEKCLPPGTVHISLPRILPVAKKLELDFAPALVGFEIRNRRSVPVFEGIVVCQEHETILLEAYAEEEYRRSLEAEKKRENLAVARWCQLLRSVTVRQRLQATYQNPQDGSYRPWANDGTPSTQRVLPLEEQDPDHQESIKKNHTAHEHLFLEENQGYDEETGIRTKICACGYTLTVEEM